MICDRRQKRTACGKVDSPPRSRVSLRAARTQERRPCLLADALDLPLSLDQMSEKAGSPLQRTQWRPTQPPKSGFSGSGDTRVFSSVSYAIRMAFEKKKITFRNFSDCQMR